MIYLYLVLISITLRSRYSSFKRLPLILRYSFDSRISLISSSVIYLSSFLIMPMYFCSVCLYSFEVIDSFGIIAALVFELLGIVLRSKRTQDELSMKPFDFDIREAEVRCIDILLFFSFDLANRDLIGTGQSTYFPLYIFDCRCRVNISGVSYVSFCGVSFALDALDAL